MEHDVPLDRMLGQVTEHPDMTGIVPLAGLGREIRLRAAETPGTFRVAIWSTGENPFQETEAVTVNALQFAALMGPQIKKNQSVLERRGRRLVEEAEKFLQELSA